MDYDDIIHHPYPFDASRPRMPMTERAAQFAPFAALSGHGDAIAEAETEHVESFSMFFEAED